MSLKWGIAATGKVSNDFVTALQGLPKGSHEVIAVAAREIEKAEKFAKVHNIPNAYEGYEKLGENQNIEVVYIATIHPQHYKIAKKMLELGKHVLCEKPLGMNQKQANKLVEIAMNKNLFLMEAVWSRFFPVFAELRKCIDSGKIGEVIQVSAEMGMPIIEKDRIKKKSLGGGITLDFGIHSLKEM